MKIVIEVKNDLKKYFDNKELYDFQLEKEYITIKEILDRFNFIENDKRYTMFLKNGKKVDIYEKLYAKDHLVIFKPVGGG